MLRPDGGESWPRTPLMDLEECFPEIFCLALDSLLAAAVGTRDIDLLALGLVEELLVIALAALVLEVPGMA